MTEENVLEGEPQVAETSESSSEGSVFDEIFGQESNAFEEPQVGDAQQSVEPQQEQIVPGEQINPESDSYKYWQSEADKRAYERDEAFKTLGVNNVDELKAVSQEMRDVLPIAKYIKGNPEVLNVVDKSLRGEPIGNQQETENQETPVEKPVKPVRPSGYDDIDAYQDSESDSYKYRIAVEQYRDDMVEYTQKENEALRNTITQGQQQQIRNQQVSQLTNELINQRGYSQEQADDFINWASQDESFTMDNLIQLHGQIRGITPNQPVAPQNPQEQYVDPTVQNKVQQMISERQRLSQPGAVATATGSDNTSNRPVEERVMNDMITSFNKSNPFT
tara:strand:+ start:2278 stop:3279 length:1002 start_codon:yes stop_codon:yes gene_type:complete